MTKIVTNDTKKNKKHEISADNDDYYNGNYCEIYDENSNGNDHENHDDDVTNQRDRTTMSGTCEQFDYNRKLLLLVEVF